VEGVFSGYLFFSLIDLRRLIGIIELGLTGALVGFGGSNASVVAAVLVYRFLTVVPTLTLGLLASLTLRRKGPEVRARQQPEFPSP